MQRGPPYSDRPAPRGSRHPAAQQLRAAVYPQEQPVPAPYHAPDGPPLQAHPPPHYEQPVAPHSARREGLDRFGITSACCSMAETCHLTLLAVTCCSPVTLHCTACSSAAETCF